jgi:hypothetical protein
MRSLKLFLCMAVFVTSPLLARVAPTISSISPSSIRISNGEWFVTIQGAHFLPSSGASVVFDGPSGISSIGPSTSTDTKMSLWVPASVVTAPGYYSVKVRVPDGKGTLDSNAVTFRVLGSTVFLEVPVFVLAEALNLQGGPAQFSVTATSELGQATYIDCSRRSGDFFPFDTSRVDCKATDDFGGEAAESFDVRVADTTPPTINVPREMNVFGKPDGSYVRYDVTASDTVDPEVKPVCAPESGAFFRIGTSTVTCTSVDRFKNQGTATFRVHVGDDETPALIIPASITAEAESREGAKVTWDAKAVAANGAPADIRCDPAPGALFLIGTTTVKCTGFGPTGKTISELFDVQVVDHTAPRLVLPRDFSEQAPSPEGAYPKYSATATDAVEGDTFVSCSQASGTLFPPGDTTVTCSSQDKAGNQSTGSFVITVVPWFDDTQYVTIEEPAPSQE